MAQNEGLLRPVGDPGVSGRLRSNRVGVALCPVYVENTKPHACMYM